MKKIKKVLIAFSIMIILFPVSIRVVNNGMARSLEKRLMNCELPPDSELIDSASVAGKMEGNGNGMQWFGIVLIKSQMTEDALREWYKNQLVTGENEVISVLKQETSKVFEYGRWRFKNYSDEENCYQVRLVKYSIVGFENSIWESILNTDLRGH